MMSNVKSSISFLTLILNGLIREWIRRAVVKVLLRLLVILSRWVVLTFTPVDMITSDLSNFSKKVDNITNYDFMLVLSILPKRHMMPGFLMMSDLYGDRDRSEVGF